MKLFFSVISAIASMLVFTFTSCKDDSSSLEVSGYNVIQSIHLGKIERKVSLKTAQGKDTIVYTDVNTAFFPLSIDHLRGRIFNNDSLPIGTQLQKVVFRTFSSTGTTTIRDLRSQQELPFSTNDTIDLSQPRYLTVWSEGNNGKRVYELSLRVHKEDGKVFRWSNLGTAQALQPITSQRALIAREHIYIFGKEGGQSVLLKAPLAHPEQLQRELVASDIDPYQVIFFNDTFFGLSMNKLVKSKDGIRWENLPIATTFDALLAPGTKTLTAVNSNGFYISNDTAKTFTLAKADTPDSLVQSNVASVNIAMGNEKAFEHLLIVGKQGHAAHVWKHSIDLDSNMAYPFIFYNGVSSTTKYPGLHRPVLYRYNNGVLALSEKANGGLNPFYISYDDGITWKTGEIPLPKTQPQQSVSMIIDAQHFIYLFCGGSGEIWRGRLNALGWQPIETVFK